MFESLSSRLTGIFNGLGSKGRLTEKDVDVALRDIRMALLEADVNSVSYTHLTLPTIYSV